MGYTHYWEVKSKVSKKKYAAAVKDIQTLVMVASKLHPDFLGNGSGDPGSTPEFEDGVAFNGIGSESHETFAIPKAIAPGFEFCKTAQKPYDTVVTACLAVLAFHLGKSVAVSSDGVASDWSEGVRLASSILKKAIKNPIK